MKRIPYDNIPPRPRTRIDDLRDFLPYIALVFIGFAFIIWFEGTLKSFLIWVFEDAPLWLWDGFSASSLPMKFLILGIIVLILWYILDSRGRNKPPYQRGFDSL